MRSRNARRRGQRLRAGATPAYRKFTWTFAIAISAIVRRSPTKTDSSKDGPEKDAPAIMPTGMMGDRAAVIFAAPEEITKMIEPRC
jgi:hypothetical protein